MISREKQRLKERVFNLFPITHFGYLKLLSLLDIEPRTDIETAAITTGDQSVLQINMKFIEKHCQTDERFSMLILHEIMHLLLGHTRMYKRITPAQNIAFDAIINAHICRLFPQPEYTALFREFYSDTKLPEALLRPPDGWNDENPQWKLTGEAGELHKALYLSQDVTTSEILTIVEQFVVQIEGVAFPFLLGSHPTETTKNSKSWIDADTLKEMRNIVAKWPQEILKRGRDDGGDIEELNIQADYPRKRAIKVLRKALLSLFDFSSPHSVIQRIHSVNREALLPWRTTKDRKGIIMEPLSSQPQLLWKGEILDKALSFSEPPTLYIDVSGSMWAVLPLLYGAFGRLKSFINPTICIFSTEVVQISLLDLKKGKIITTNGTNISCVTRDMIARNIKRALIVTDGFCEFVPEDDRKKLRTAQIATVITDEGDSAFAKQLGATIYRLPPLQGE